MSITYDNPIVIYPTPAELADEFISWSTDKQVEFFNLLALSEKSRDFSWLSDTSPVSGYPNLLLETETWIAHLYKELAARKTALDQKRTPS